MYNEVIDLIKRANVPKLYRRKSRCCGCAACYSVCPQRAIEMRADREGFTYPVIDKKKCVRCHLCAKVCPILNNANDISKDMHKE